jgi:hypothetical protein
MITSMIAGLLLLPGQTDDGIGSFRSLVKRGDWAELERRIKKDRTTTKRHHPVNQAFIFVEVMEFTENGAFYGNAMTAVRMYHEAGYDVTADGNAALRRAMYYDHNGAMIRRLISYGASAKGLWAGGPVRHNLPELLEFLLSKGAEAQSEYLYPTLNDGRSFAVRTPLQYAAWKGYADCLKVLVRAKVDLNARNSVTRRTALHEAVEGGHGEVIKILLRAGAKPSIQDGRKQTPAQMAAALKRPDLVKLLSARRS